MARFIVTKVGRKNTRISKIAKERVEIRILPLIGCFLLAILIWMAVVGTQIRQDELQTARQGEPPLPVGAETQSGSDARSPETAGQEARETPDAPYMTNGLPSVSS